MTVLHESLASSPEAQRPIYVGLGFGYNQAKNDIVSEYIAEQDYDTVPTLPDVEVLPSDMSFTIALRGLSRQVKPGLARSLLANNAIPNEDIESRSGYQERRADALVAMLDRTQNTPVNAIFGSADALSGVLAMAEHPELFDAVVLDCPAGLVRRPPVGRAIVGLARNGFKDKVSGRKADSDNAFAFDQGRRQTMVGGKAIPLSVAASYQARLLSGMRQAEDAPGISLRLGMYDSMTPADLILKGLLSSHDVDYVVLSDTGHGIGREGQSVIDEDLKLFPKMAALKIARKAGEPMPPLTERMIFRGSIPETTKNKFMRIAADVDARSDLAT